jgi:hypothetical protein
MAATGDRYTAALACFVCSGSDFGQTEEVKDIVDEIPGRVRFPDP